MSPENVDSFPTSLHPQSKHEEFSPISLRFSLPKLGWKIETEIEVFYL